MPQRNGYPGAQIQKTPDQNIENVKEESPVSFYPNLDDEPLTIVTNKTNR
jgi:hypothetical protein